MGMNTVTRPVESPLNFLFPSEMVSSSSLCSKVQEVDWNKACIQARARALLGRLPSSYSVSQSRVFPACGKNSTVSGWTGRILPKPEVGGTAPVASESWLRSCRLISLLGWLSRSLPRNCRSEGHEGCLKVTWSEWSFSSVPTARITQDEAGQALNPQRSSLGLPTWLYRPPHEITDMRTCNLSTRNE